MPATPVQDHAAPGVAPEEGSGPDVTLAADDVAPSRRPLVAGAIAGAWSLLVGIGLVTCLVMLTWALSPNSVGDAAAAWRAAGLTWLAAHQVPLTLGGEPLTLLPLGALLLGLLLARRAGAWTGRLLPSPTPGEVGLMATGAGLLYGAGGAAIAWLSAADVAFAVPARAALVTGLVGATGAVWGIAPEAGLVPAVRARMPDAVWRTLAAGLAAVLGLVAVGAVLVALGLVRHFAQAGAALGALEAGVLGSAGLTLLDILTLPNLAIWALSVVVGPGFRLGELGELSAFGGEVASLPALPVLAAIPTSIPGWVPVLLAVPVLLGVLAGRIRWGRDLPTPLGALTGALALGGVVAVLLAGLCLAGSGSLGSARLAGLGPQLWAVVGAGTGLVVLGFLLEAGFQSVRLSWELHRAEQRSGASGTTGGAAAPIARDAVEGDRGGAAPGVTDTPTPASVPTTREVVGAPTGPAALLVPAAAAVAAVASAVRLPGVVTALVAPRVVDQDAAEQRDPGPASVVDVREPTVDLRSDDPEPSEGCTEASAEEAVDPADAAEGDPGEAAQVDPGDLAEAADPVEGAPAMPDPGEAAQVDPGRSEVRPAVAVEDDDTAEIPVVPDGPVEPAGGTVEPA